MPELAYVNGTIMPIDEARVPVEDRAYQFGDAIYEFFASYNGRIFAMEEHLDRLERSLHALDFKSMDRDMIRNAILEINGLAGFERAGIYLQISRGVAPRNHAFPEGAAPQIILTVRPAPETPAALLAKGAAAITVTDIRWQRCDIKTVQLLPNAWAKQRAIDAGADDAIFVARDGVVREGTASNLFIATHGTLLTHPLTSHILAGITRSQIIDICQREGISVQEVSFDQAAMMAADEVFLTGTTAEVMPLSRINDHGIGDGLPGPLTKELFGLFRKLAETK